MSTYLDTDGHVREDPHPHPRALDSLNLPLDSLLGSTELLRADTHSISFDPDAPVPICKSGALGRASGRDGQYTFMALDELDLARRELRLCSCKNEL